MKFLKSCSQQWTDNKDLLNSLQLKPITVYQFADATFQKSSHQRLTITDLNYTSTNMRYVCK